MLIQPGISGLELLPREDQLAPALQDLRPREKVSDKPCPHFVLRVEGGREERGGGHDRSNKKEQNRRGALVVSTKLAVGGTQQVARHVSELVARRAPHTRA